MGDLGWFGEFRGVGGRRSASHLSRNRPQGEERYAPASNSCSSAGFGQLGQGAFEDLQRPVIGSRPPFLPLAGTFVPGLRQLNRTGGQVGGWCGTGLPVDNGFLNGAFLPSESRPRFPLWLVSRDARDLAEANPLVLNPGDRRSTTALRALLSNPTSGWKVP